MRHLPLLVTIFLVLIVSSASAHPWEACTPKEMPYPYGKEGRGLPSAWSINEIQFVDTYPDPTTLTDAEKYMIAGAKDIFSGEVLFPWESRVQKVAMMYYTRFGYLPQELSPEIIADAFGVENPSEVPGNFINELVSPLTGQYPRLDATYPSPGDIYMQVLTEDEKAFIAAQDDDLYNLWYNGQKYDYRLKMYHNIDLNSLVVTYTRIYGWNGVIHTCLVSDYLRNK